MNLRTVRDMLASSVVALEFNFSRLRQTYITAVLAALLVIAFLWFALLAPPSRFPAGAIITIEEGSTVREVAERFYAEGIVRSPVAYNAIMRITGALPDAGKYVFHRPVGLFQVAYRTAVGGFGIEPTRIVFFEGTTVREMARAFKESFPEFDADAFIEQGLPLEGYLFPNTYFFYPDITPEDAIITLFSHFNNERVAISSEVVASKHSEKDLIIMASILQKEGRGLEEMRAIAGVLWHRIDLGMPLQVDAVFSYIKDVPLYSPKFSELEIDSPYNTYINKGLPPGPIGNPGADAILAAATPATTSALFYLTGNDGITRFAKTFEEHKRNRALYLD